MQNIKTTATKLVGYTRAISEDEVHLRQVPTLFRHHCDILLTEISPHTDTKKLLSQLNEGDTLLVTDLVVIGLALVELLTFIKQLCQSNITLRSLNDNIQTDTTVMYWLKALDKAHHQRKKQRNNLGLKCARARGCKGGRPTLLDKNKIKMLKTLAKDEDHSIEAICTLLNISRASYYRYLQRHS